MLVEYFASLCGEGWKAIARSTKYLKLCVVYWPGNIRELQYRREIYNPLHRDTF